MQLTSLVALWLACLLHSPGSRSQIIFQDAGYTTPTYTNAIGNIANFSPFIVNNGGLPGICFCVNNQRCDSAGGGNPSNGAGVIDIRIVNTAGGVPTGIVTPIATPVSSGIVPAVVPQSFCQYNMERCCPSTGFSCGIRYSPFTNAPQPVGAQSAFGSYPWQGVIFTSGNVYVGSGVLIDHLHFLTVAHKVSSYLTTGGQLKVRMGEWDSSNTNEQIPYQEYNVARIFIHPLYSSSTLSNSIAILRLSSPVPLGAYPTITTGCLTNTPLSNMRCWVAGWGTNGFTSGSAQSIQQQVDVPIVDQATCQTRLRNTKLGSSFVLDNFSFMCAGGEAGKDACVGDGGAPLVCPVGGRWFVAGLVAWGIGCGTTDVPGVYMNVSNYINWIQSTTTSP